MKPPAPLEHIEQRALVAWLHVAKWRGVPLSELAFAVPNGSWRHKAVAGKLKAEGVRSGVPDLVVPIRTPSYGSLYVELKRRDRSKVLASQLECHARLRWAGQCVRVAHGADEAKTFIRQYLADTGHPIVIGYSPDPQVDWSSWEIDR